MNSFQEIIQHMAEVYSHQPVAFMCIEDAAFYQTNGHTVTITRDKTCEKILQYMYPVSSVYVYEMNPFSDYQEIWYATMCIDGEWYSLGAQVRVYQDEIVLFVERLVNQEKPPRLSAQLGEKQASTVIQQKCQGIEQIFACYLKELPQYRLYIATTANRVVIN